MDSLDLDEIIKYVKKANLANDLQTAIAKAGFACARGKWPELLPTLSTTDIERIVAAKVFTVLEALQKRSLIAEEESDEEDEEELEPPPPAKKACTTDDVLKLLERNNDDMMRKFATMLAAQPRQAPAQPVHTPPMTHTRDLDRWREAFDGGRLALLTDAWLAGSLRHSAAGTTAQTHLRASLTAQATTIKELCHAHHNPPDQLWAMLEPIVVRALAFETAAELFLKGGTSPAFVQEAADALACEKTDFWKGTTMAISRKADEVTKALQLACRQVSHAPAGRFTPRRRRGPEGGR